MTKFLIILTILTSCNFINTDQKRTNQVDSYSMFFYENKATFERIVKQIENNKNLNLATGKWINPEEFDDLTNKQLRRLEIEHVTINQTQCGQKEIEFTTSWINYPLGKMYLTRDCPDEKSEKGNYWKGGFIETWGLGDGWTIWIDSDAI